MNTRFVWALVRLVCAVLIAAAVVAQAVATYQFAADRGRDVAMTVANFFSFFTIISNCLGAIVMLVGGVWLLMHRASRRGEPRWLSLAFVSVGTYMLITGIVYNLLLRSIVLEQGTTVAWSNEVLHLIGPLVFAAELIVDISRPPLPWFTIVVAALLPLVWAAYTMIRGEMVTAPATGDPYWYPYPFLNPHTLGGYGPVALYIVGIAVAIIAVAACAVWRTRARPRSAGAIS